MRLHDTQRSGNAWKIRLLAGFLGMPMTRRSLSIDRGELMSPAFAKLNPLRQVPVLELPDGRTLSESMAILFFLSAGTGWWPQDRFAQAETLRWMSFEQARHMHPLAQLRLHLALHPDWPVEQKQLRQWHGQAMEALECLERQLAAGGPGAWVATAAHPSIADVALYPYTRLAGMGGIDLRGFAAIGDWLGRFERLAGYEPLFAGRPDLTESTQERSHDRPG